MSQRRGRVGRALLVAAGVLAARAALPAAFWLARGRGWNRTNFRGTEVSLAGGPAVAAAASLTAAAGAPSLPVAAAALVAGLGAGSVGLYDDLVGTRPEHRAKGFHGHLAALRQGRITSGAVKIAGVGAAGLATAALLEYARPGPRSPLNTLLGAGVVAGAANLLNLLDLRPGRALKVSLLAGVPLAGVSLAGGPGGGLAAGPVGAAAAALPEDLAERTMLGDCGANALGAVLGAALAARTGPRGRAVALVVIAGLTAASERVSFTQVIAGQPVLRRLDELGRSPGQGRDARQGRGAGAGLGGRLVRGRSPGQGRDAWQGRGGGAGLGV